MSLARSVGDEMRAIPGPTEAWADIVGHLVWPVTLLLLLRWYRAPIATAAKAVAARMRTDDLTTPFLAMRHRDDLQPLDSAGDTSDAAVQERLFELIADAEAYEEVVAWIERRAGGEVTTDSFLTAEECGTLRREYLDERQRRV